MTNPVEDQTCWMQLPHDLGSSFGSRLVVLNWDQFHLRGTFGNVHRHFFVTPGGKVLMASSG